MPLFPLTSFPTPLHAGYTHPRYALRMYYTIGYNNIPHYKPIYHQAEIMPFVIHLQYKKE